MKKKMMIKQIKRRGKQRKEGKSKDYKQRERNNQKKKKRKKIKNLMRRIKRNKLLRDLMNQPRKKRKIKKKKKKSMTNKQNLNLLKKEMILMNQVLQNIQTMKILVIMQAKNSFHIKVLLKDKNQKKSKKILPQMMKNLRINKKKKIPK